VADIEFPLPDLGEGLVEATVLEWLVAEGDEVERNAPLVEVETTKSAVELPSPQAGRVLRLHAAAGETVQVGEPLITFAGQDSPGGAEDAGQDSPGIVGTVPTRREPTRRVRLTPPED